MGRDLEDPLPITAVVSQLYNAGMKEHAGDDLSAVAEVGRRVGYSDPGYFVKSFGRAHGVTPLGWRRVGRP